MVDNSGQAELKRRYDEIDSLVQQPDYGQAGLRLLDFAKDFGSKEQQRRSKVIISDYNCLKRESRTSLTAEEIRVRRNLYIDSLLTEAEEIQEFFANKPAEASYNGSQATVPDVTVPIDQAFINFRLARRDVDCAPTTSAESTVVFRGENLGRRYRRGGAFHLKGISLELRLGEVTGLVGVNGAGKTTLLRIIAGELNANDGACSYPALNKKENVDWPHVRRQIGYVPQRTDRWVGSLQNNLHWHASLNGILRDDNDAIVEFYLLRLGLENHRNASWSEINGGHRTRFELAKVLVTRPRLVVLDEPLAALDIVSQHQFLLDLRDIASSPTNPISIIFSSQELYEVETIADNIVCLGQGETLYSGPSHNIGADRTHNTFEIGCRCDRQMAIEALREAGGEVIEQNVSGFLVSTALSVDGTMFLDKVRDSGIGVYYFREISKSCRSFFPSGRL